MTVRASRWMSSNFLSLLSVVSAYRRVMELFMAGFASAGSGSVGPRLVQRLQRPKSDPMNLIRGRGRVYRRSSHELHEGVL